MCHVTNRTRTNKHKLDRTRTQKLTMFCIYNYSPLFPIAFTPLLCSMFIIIIMYAVFQTVKVMPKKTGLVATVIRQDIIATNGYINIIDQVRLSLTTKLNNDHTIKRTLSKKQSLLKEISVRLLSLLHDHSVFSSPPQRPMTSNFEGFSIPDFTRYHFYNVFGMTRSLTGDEPGTSRTRSKHSTTRLSRWRYQSLVFPFLSDVYYYS